MNTVNEWINNNNDKRNPRIIFDLIKNTGSGQTAMAYILCLIVLDLPNNQEHAFARYKAFEMLKILVTIPHLSYGSELLLQKRDHYNSLAYHVIKKYGLPPDTRYFATGADKNLWISKM